VRVEGKKDMSKTPVEPLTYSIPEAATALGISKEALWRRVWEGSVPSIRLGRRVVISKRAVSRIIDGDTAPARREG